MSKNTTSKGLVLLIVRSVSNNNNLISDGKRTTASVPMMITSLENTGDVIIENTFMTMG